MPEPRSRRRRQLMLAAGACLPAWGRAAEGLQDRHFGTSDGVRLHWLEGGSGTEPPLVFVPGWTMPAWIWMPQLEHFSRQRRVIALDPRGQGESAIPATGYTHRRRAADIQELLVAAGTGRVVLVGWSLAVLECLQLLSDPAARARVAGLVLVDNSVGEGDPPKGKPTFLPRLKAKRRDTMQAFVKAMFKTPQPADWLATLTESTLRMPLEAAVALLSQPTPREFWRETLYSLDLPVLYVYTPRFARQGELVSMRKPSIETMLFDPAGHALFVDDAPRFNEALEAFAARVPR